MHIHTVTIYTLLISYIFSKWKKHAIVINYLLVLKSLKSVIIRLDSSRDRLRLAASITWERSGGAARIGAIITSADELVVELEVETQPLGKHGTCFSCFRDPDTPTSVCVKYDWWKRKDRGIWNLENILRDSTFCRSRSTEMNCDYSRSIHSF